jgi:hypothetical protein
MPMSATGGCELRTRIRGLSLAKYRGAPPVPILGQEGPALSVTYGLLRSGGERFAVSYRPTEITSQPSFRTYVGNRRPAQNEGVDALYASRRPN